MMFPELETRSERYTNRDECYMRGIHRKNQYVQSKALPGIEPGFQESYYQNLE